jgi:hypothetical protein
MLKAPTKKVFDMQKNNKLKPLMLYILLKAGSYFNISKGFGELNFGLWGPQVCVKTRSSASLV